VRLDADAEDIITDAHVEEGAILSAEVSIKEKKTRSIQLIHIAPFSVEIWNDDADDNILKRDSSHPLE
jgi:hypothetical protein